MANLEALVEVLKQLAPQLREYEPANETWQQAEKKALEARDEVETMLRSAEDIARLRGSGALQDMKRLVPDITREEIAELKVSDFVLGMIFEKPFAAFERTYRGFGAEYAKELSNEARKSSNLIKTSYVYGEILFFPFADIIRWVAPFLPDFAIFYDLGSGTGKAVIAASLVHPFDQAIGIELLEPLAHCAEKRKTALEKLKSPLLKTDIDFMIGDLLTTKWEDGDVVFCHGTCFNDEEWTKISRAAEKIKQGSFFISTTHVLRTGLFEVVKSLNFTMSWGTAAVYIHRRRKIGRWAAEMLRGGRSTRTDLLQQQSQNQQMEGRQATPAEALTQ
ncbi:Histone methylation protein DOT1 [Phytophthora infestans]|uniref:Histone-lysine N-methyltransferase, H3 lysine-79 specific n=1 Tax=Phytophthora infestans TaxID=4787 RepID=A0A833WMK8_PHYIN|nr:Histone methylation protein DOT1 [Phytophthora infestans]KAF4046233.1 Histone methylation protein DOT1 [Phytophthora infestans]KAF4139852.1 Histone methylation protein DOT1 [Phytophthora infestans]